MSTSVGQVTRLLSEIPYIQAHPGISVHEVAQVFGISAEQVRNDVSVAIFCGLPGGYPSDLIDVDVDAMGAEGALYMHNPTPLGRPLRLSGAEAASLQAALLAIRAVGDDRTTLAIDSLMAKIAHGEAAGLPTQVEVRVSSGDERIRDRLVDAIAQAERVELTYDGLARGTTTHPVVDPAEILARDGAGYLSAYDVGAQGWRTYRMDRIAEVRPTGDLTADHGPKPGPDAWARSLAAGETVRLTIAHQAGWITEYYPVNEVIPLGTGEVMVSLPVVDPAWLVRLLLSLGEQVHRVEPESYSLAARDLAREALDAYARLGARTSADAQDNSADAQDNSADDAL